MKWLLLVILLAGAFRFTYADRRPMHADEAIQADRFGTLLESHAFSYDLSEYHGPALAYATLVTAWAARVRSYPELTEGLLRAVPAIFGILLVILSYRIVAHLSRRAAVLAALFTAVAPGLVYYSRSYIPEMMLVFFSAAVIGCGVEYGYRPSLRWAVAAGVAAGLMYATKETAVLVLVAMAAGLLGIRPRVKFVDVLAGIAAAILTASVLFSVMLSYSAAIIDSVLSFAPYIRRAFGEGANAHPWYYYLQTLARSGDIVFVLGGIFAFPRIRSRNKLVTFLGVYAVVLTVLYSILRYKVPWCALGFLHAWILLAAIALAPLLQAGRRRVGFAAILAASGCLAIQAWRLALPLAANPGNPWVYAQTLPGVFAVRDRLESIARQHPAGHAVPIQIITTDNFWPLPWYLRQFTGVQWLGALPPKTRPAPVILLSPDLETPAANFIYESAPPGERELYVNLFPTPTYLRPGLEVRGYTVNRFSQ